MFLKLMNGTSTKIIQQKSHISKTYDITQLLNIKLLPPLRIVLAAGYFSRHTGFWKKQGNTHLMCPFQ
jgi:hypothetical protein